MSNPVLESHTIISPYGISLGVSSRGNNKGKDNIFYLNLNKYRNAHFYILNNAKVAYYELMKHEVRNLPKFDKLNIQYTVFAKNSRKFDIMNICSVVDKFFCDVLVTEGIIEDDNYTIVENIQCKFGGIDSTNERIEILLNGEISKCKKKL